MIKVSILYFLALSVFSCQNKNNTVLPNKEIDLISCDFKTAMSYIEEDSPNWFNSVTVSKNDYKDSTYNRLRINYSAIEHMPLRFLHFSNGNYGKSVDIFSNSYELKISNTDTVLVGAEPDAAIKYFNFKENQVATLKTYGSTTFLHEVIWIGDECFAVLGLEEDFENEALYYPIVLLYDINSSTEKIYSFEPMSVSQDQFTNKASRYIKPKAR